MENKTKNNAEMIKSLKRFGIMNGISACLAGAISIMFDSESFFFRFLVTYFFISMFSSLLVIGLSWLGKQGQKSISE